MNCTPFPKERAGPDSSELGLKPGTARNLARGACGPCKIRSDSACAFFSRSVAAAAPELESLPCSRKRTLESASSSVTLPSSRSNARRVGWPVVLARASPRRTPLTISVAADFKRLPSSNPGPMKTVPPSTAINATTINNSTSVSPRCAARFPIPEGVTRFVTHEALTRAFRWALGNVIACDSHERSRSFVGCASTLGHYDVVFGALLLVGAVGGDDDFVVGAGQRVVLVPGILGGLARIELFFLHQLAHGRAAGFVVGRLPLLNGSAHDARSGLRVLDLRFLVFGQREDGDAAGDHGDDRDHDQNFDQRYTAVDAFCLQALAHDRHAARYLEG